MAAGAQVVEEEEEEALEKALLLAGLRGDA